MRISDWSSDVCSSDLDTVAQREDILAIEHDLPLGRVGERVPLEILLRGQDRVVDEIVGDLGYEVGRRGCERQPADRIDVDLAFGADDTRFWHVDQRGQGAQQIGRASGRESVCPYV